jgi:hypothetical protein
MSDERKSLQTYPPDVLLPFGAGSDIDNGRNHTIFKRFYPLGKNSRECSPEKKKILF